ncbi:MAG: protein kinase [Muribaculaceae bacterium]|jgi:serine/threonine protein kinase|nr:protein kinase [Muribaculaceae bacterium]
METRDALQVGTELKSPEFSYIIKSVLEQGSFSITYLASAKMIAHGPLGDIETEVKVVIKEFYMQGLSSRGRDGSVGGSSGSSLVTNYRRKFRREAENLSKMHHENIVKVFEVFGANGTTYYVMQYIEGMSLDEYIISHGHLSEKEASENIATIARALGYMHSQKMLHLDLKPMNIMRQNDGKLFLMGFGLLKNYDSNGESESSISVGLGTPGYAPLEQDDIDDSKAIAATLDIYALGATYYKMLTGKTPPNALNVLNDQEKKLKETLTGSSEKSISLVLSMMSPLKGSRPQNVEEVLALLEKDTVEGREEKGKITDELTQFLETKRSKKLKEDSAQKEEVERKAEEQKRKKNKRILLIGSYVVLLAIICGVIWYVSSPNEFITAANSNAPVAVDLGLSVKWASCNVGATKPEECGGLYGLTDPTGTNSSGNYHDYPWGNNISGTEYDIARAKWGGSWRLPTNEECKELNEKCKWTWTIYNGVKGMKVTGPNGNSIFLPAAGNNDGTGVKCAGTAGYYWSGTVLEFFRIADYGIDFSSKGSHDFNGWGRGYGLSVRPVEQSE